MHKVDTLIIGGGITGLSAASFLKKDHNYLVLEGSSELGGYCKTTIRNGFTWDYSGHFFHFRNTDIKDYMMSRMECDVVEVKKITDIDFNGHIIDFPFQYNVHQLPKKDFIECLKDMYHLPAPDTSSFKSFVSSTSGKAIAEKFLIPYNEKLYACDLDKLDAGAMGRFFPKPINFDTLMEKITTKDTYESYNGTFIYPVEGSYEFIRSFPLAISSMPVSFDASSLLKLSVSMSYIRYIVIKPPKNPFTGNGFNILGPGFPSFSNASNFDVKGLFSPEAQASFNTDQFISLSTFNKNAQALSDDTGLSSEDARTIAGGGFVETLIG
jgi:hypothetical protein